MQLKEAAILIVEDEPDLREIIGVWFSRMAGRVLTSGNGAEALELLAGNRIDLVLSDVRMPVMDGVTLLKRIRALGNTAPSVVLISGFSDIDAREAYNLGAEAFLQKPMERQELLQSVNRSLASRTELWSTPVDEVPAATLELSYPSLARAIEQGKIAFGRGGFCIELSPSLPEEPIAIRLEFKQEKQILEGIGIVRWNVPAEGQTGIDLLYLVPASRKWLAALIEKTGATAFIPASTAGRPGVEAKSA